MLVKRTAKPKCVWSELLTGKKGFGVFFQVREKCEEFFFKSVVVKI